MGILAGHRSPVKGQTDSADSADPVDLTPGPGARSVQRARRLSAGGLGPELAPAGQGRRCARIRRMTAGSWTVAINRIRPPQEGHAVPTAPPARVGHGMGSAGRARV